MLFFQTHVCLTCPSLFTKFISFSSRLITVFNPWGLRYVFMLAILSWFCFDSIADAGGQRGYRIYVIRVRKQGAERGRTLWTFEGFHLFFFLLSMYLLPKDTKSPVSRSSLICVPGQIHCSIACVLTSRCSQLKGRVQHQPWCVCLNLLIRAMPQGCSSFLTSSSSKDSKSTINLTKY